MAHCCCCSVDSLVKTLSSSWRSEGNKYFSQAHQDGLAPIIKESRLQEAIKFYHRALSAACENKDDAASACKNLAKSNFGLICVTDDTETEIKLFKECFQYCSKALEYGRDCKSLDWLMDVDALYRTVYFLICDQFDVLSTELKINLFESLASVVSEKDRLYPDINHHLAEAWLSEACMALNDNDFKTSLNALKEMYRPVEEVKRYGKHRDQLMTDIECFQCDITIQMARTESMQAISTGDTLLENHLLEDADLNMDLIYTVIDYYRHAMVLTRGVEIELEAMALSKLGKLYDQVLKIKHRASDCFHKCLQLAATLVPRVLTSEAWYKVANETLMKYQMESYSHQERERQKERQKYLDELKTELKEISEAKKKWKDQGGEFLMFIYEKFPPKVTCTIPKKEDVVGKEMTSLKKLFQKAVIYYHPDKQDVERFGMKWKVLSEEITKDLSTFYEITKGLPQPTETEE